MDNKWTWVIVGGLVYLLTRKKGNSNLSGSKRRSTKRITKDWYVAQVFEKKGNRAIYHGSRSFPTKEEAEAWENKYHPKSELKNYYVVQTISER